MQSRVGLRICFGWWSIGKMYIYVLGSKVESRSLHVLSTAQADAESSVTAWPTRLCGWLVCFEEDLSGGHGHRTKYVVALAKWGLLYCVFIFNSSTVVSTCAQYLYQKTGLMSCSLPVLGGMKFCLFFFFFFFLVCSRLTGLRTLRYTKNIC